MRPILAIAVLLTGLSACGDSPAPTASANKRDLTFASADGVALHATLYAPEKPAKNPPGLVLVHMVGSNRSAWESFATRAQRAGYLCLAFDARGHGESTGQGGQRNRCHRPGGQIDHAEQQQRMHDRRHPGVRARADVDRSPGDRTGGRHAAEYPRGHRRQSLADQFAVRVVGAGR